GHDRVPCSEGGLGELHAHAASGAGDEPHLVVRHVRTSPCVRCPRSLALVSFIAQLERNSPILMLARSARGRTVVRSRCTILQAKLSITSRSEAEGPRMH